ncbi:hypothetical protein PVAP13_1NG431219, partial [Panicum virgatum]
LGLHEQLLFRRGDDGMIESEGHGWMDASSSCTRVSRSDPAGRRRGMFRGCKRMSVPGLDRSRELVRQLSTPAEAKRMARNCVHNGPDRRRLNQVLPLVWDHPW